MTTTASAGSPRRVLIIVQNLPVPFDRRVWLEATTLARAGYQVSVICPKMSGFTRSFELLDGVAIYRHPMPVEASGALGYVLEYPLCLLFELWLTARIFLTRGFDLIHACNPPDLIFLVAWPFKHLLGRRFIFDHHDLNPELFEAKFGRRGVLHQIVSWLEARTFHLADVSIATNESYRRIAIERGRMPPERVFVVRSGPPLERFHRVEPNPRWRNGRRFVVGYVGTMGVQEGIPYLVEAVRQLVEDRGRRDVQFVLVGGGGEVENMRKLARERGLTEFITFTGRVPDAELLEILSTADVCVNPDEYNELNDKSTMNKIIEYMAVEKPVVQFELTEGRFTAGEASLYARRNDSVDLADRIVELLDDEALRKRMGALGRSRVEAELAWEHQAPRLLAAYDVAFGELG